MDNKIEFMNVTGQVVWLRGPNGEKTQFTKFERKLLPEYYRKYVGTHLREVRKVVVQQPLPRANPKPVERTMIHPQQRLMPRHQLRSYKPVKLPPKPKQEIHQVNRPPVPAKPQVIRYARKIPGKVGVYNEQATAQLHHLLRGTSIAISNDVGVGILSYNRLPALRRLVDSIRRHTDLLKTTVFISDESNDQEVKAYIRSLPDFCVLDNSERLGVAGNSNRLMHCLERFRYKFLLNDDVEIMARGWEDFYIRGSIDTKIHHFCLRQPGVCGASLEEGSHQVIAGHKVQTITEKPHGAVMFFDHTAFAKAGYFDETRFGIYGMEHVDWSNRVSLGGIQLSGFHDLVGSTNFIQIHDCRSVVEERNLAGPRQRFAEVKDDTSRVWIDPSVRSAVPSISCVVPFRGGDRRGSIRTVLQSLKAHHFPAIDIVMVEQDDSTKVTLPEFDSVQYVLAQTPPGQPFTKAVAFNHGVAKARFKKIILHDADMLVNAGYTKQISDLLDVHDGVHIGKTVLYLSRESTETTNTIGRLETPQAERTVQYFEGGTLGVTKAAYIRIGGFNEDFIGYGVEDCEFFARLKTQNFHDNRTADLVHLWHDRTPGWDKCHSNNKLLDSRLQTINMEERLRLQNRKLLNAYPSLHNA